ncbi:glycosyl transferase family 1 [Planctomycetia bacterium]|nr:glycosyl transferase family 1 [Planctomycetia bacterium]
MRVVHVLSNDCPGGLNHAALRLHDELLRQGASSWVCMQAGCAHASAAHSRPETVVAHGRGHAVIRRRLDSIPAWLLSGKPYLSLSWLPTTIHETVAALNPDVVHIHQPHGATVSLAGLRRFGSPLVATLHDMWFFTGGCTFDGGCGRWSSACGNCPKVRFPHAHDASSVGYGLKRWAYPKKPITFIAPSRWIEEAARASSLLGKASIARIPYGIDVEQFVPRAKEEARRAIGLPLDAILIGFVSHEVDDPRKGIDLTAAVVAAMRDHIRGRRVLAVAIGGAAPMENLFVADSLLFLGRLSSEQLALAYPALDAVLVTSRQDNLPNVAIEAAACGTPVFGFDVGGLRDLVAIPAESLAPPFDVAALVSLLGPAILDTAGHHKRRDEARRHACDAFDIRAVAAQHQRLYDQVMHGPEAN